MITSVPLLQKQREMYRVPRGPQRFDAYLNLMADGHPERLPTLPLQTLNPMAREHVAERLDQLILLGADGWLQDFAHELNLLLDQNQNLKMCWVLADDVKGGWTNRYLTDASLRFGVPRYLPEWVPLVLWASEEPDQESLRKVAFSGVCRHIHKLEKGAPQTLQDHLDLEGFALSHAGHHTELSEEELDYTRAVLEPHLQSTHFPTLFTCLYGDEAAKTVGYPPLGLDPSAGFELALQQALKAFERN